MGEDVGEQSQVISNIKMIMLFYTNNIEKGNEHKKLTMCILKRQLCESVAVRASV